MKRRKKILIFIGSVIVLLFVSAVIERLTLPETTDDMKRRALEYGIMNSKEKPPEPFVSDGCTFFFDSLPFADLKQSCLEHDIAYFYGGTKEERKSADDKFLQDIKESGIVGKIIAYPSYFTFRVFGTGLISKSVDAHWGYGWD